MKQPEMTKEATEVVNYLMLAMSNKVDEYARLAASFRGRNAKTLEEGYDQLATLGMCNGYVQAVNDLIDIGKATLERSINTVQ